jgi:hypothetical protein
MKGQLKGVSFTVVSTDQLCVAFIQNMILYFFKSGDEANSG